MMGEPEVAGLNQSVEHWRQEFERRIALADPAHTTRGMFLKGLLESIRSLGDEELVQRCVQASGEQRLVDFFLYPIRIQLQIIAGALPALAERMGSCEAVLQHLGWRATLDLLQSPAGKAMLLAAHGSPRQLLSSLPSAYRVSTNYGSHEVVWTGLSSGRLYARQGYMPAQFHAGVLQALLEAMDARGIQVRGRQLEGLDCECEFSWSL